MIKGSHSMVNSSSALKDYIVKGAEVLGFVKVLESSKHDLSNRNYIYGEKMCKLFWTYGYKNDKGDWVIQIEGILHTLPKYNVPTENNQIDLEKNESSDSAKCESNDYIKSNAITRHKNKFNDPTKSKIIRVACRMFNMSLPSEGEEAYEIFRDRLKYFQSKGIVDKGITIICKESPQPIDENLLTVPWYEVKDPVSYRPGHPRRVSVSDYYTSVMTKSEPFMGHFKGAITIPDSCSIDPGIIEINAYEEGEFTPCTSGRVNLIDEEGISVVSDIDDTIKITQVSEGPKTVLSNTFFKPFDDVSGMVELFKLLKGYDSSFHYVSNSPRQLGKPLMDFLNEKEFPDGSLHLKEYRLKTIRQKKPLFKLETIRKIMRDFPKRKFILFGDSGELDLEIYQEIYEEFPSQVLATFIREASKPKNKINFQGRLEKAKEVTDNIYHFNDPSEILSNVKSLLRKQ